jgi:hypothetical protein
MPSTFSPLKFELITTGEQDGTWGDTTNTNIGTAIEQAITGTGDVTFTSSDVTLTLANTNNTQTARNLRLVLIGTSGGARQLIVPAIEKQYIIKNELADTVTVKNSSGTGIAVPSGATMIVFNNGTNVVDVITHATSLSVTNSFTATTLTATTSNATTFNGTTANVTTFNGTTANVTTVNTTNVAATNVTATNFKTANFTITESGGKLQFKYQGTVVMSMDATGNIVSATNVTAYGTP